MNSTIFWDITTCSPLKDNWRFGGTYRLHLQGRIRRTRYQHERSNWSFLQFVYERQLGGKINPYRDLLKWSPVCGVTRGTIFPTCRHYRFIFKTITQNLNLGLHEKANITKESSVECLRIIEFNSLYNSHPICSYSSLLTDTLWTVLWRS
jgi:hypothetical protein